MKRNIKKMLSAIMVAVMIVTMLPAGMIGGTVKASEGTNHTLIGARDVALNKQVADSWNYDNGRNYYKFSIPSQGIVSISFQSEYCEKGKWSLDVYSDTDGNKLMDEQVLDANVDKGVIRNTPNFGLSSGTYYFCVYGDYYSRSYQNDVTYWFSVNYKQNSVCETEYNDSVTDANQINTNVEYTGALQRQRDEDWYTFSIPTQGYISIDFRHKFANNDYKPWGLSLYTANNNASTNNGEGNAIVRYSYPSNVKGTTKSPNIGLAPGNYMICINKYSYDGYNNGDYNFTVNYTKDMTWETEPNNSKDTADQLNAKESKNAVFAYDHDSDDWFKFEMPESNTATFTITHDALPNASSDDYWNCNLYNASDELMKFSKWNYFTSKAGDKQTIETADLKQGTYYIKIHRYGPGTIGVPYTITVNPKPDIVAVPMYRLYNPNSGEHFFTADQGERQMLINSRWTDEGLMWYAPSKSNTPVYRMYNHNSGEHHYTTNENEKDGLVKIGWEYEGIGWYSDANKAVPLYRLYNPNATGQYEAGAHHYTPSTQEVSSLVRIGWKSEGTGWYGMNQN